jgi:hypothetical protein
VVANAFRFGPAEFFRIDDDRERATPGVRFDAPGGGGAAGPAEG